MQEMCMVTVCKVAIWQLWMVCKREDVICLGKRNEEVQVHFGFIYVYAHTGEVITFENSCWTQCVT